MHSSQPPLSRALSALAAALVATCAAASTQDLPFEPERSVIVVFRVAPDAPTHALVERMARGPRHRFAAIPAVSVKLPAEQIAELKKDPRVAYVEEDAVVQVAPSKASDLAEGAWGVEHIGARDLQGSGIEGAGVNVAVLDTGVDCTHPQLAPNCHPGHNFVEGPDAAHPTDPDDSADDAEDSHGTRVAGIIAGRDVGVAPKASIHAVKVADGGGFSMTSWITAGIDWAITNHMDIVNMSFGTTNAHESTFLKSYCDRARAAGIVLVAAAGDATTSDEVAYPAAFPSVIGVGAIDAADTLATFSPVGEGVDLVAPGVSIASAVRGGGVAVASGTSEAAPHVAGVAALLLSAGITEERGDPRTLDMVEQALESGALDLGMPGPDLQYGFGLVRAPEARTSFGALVAAPSSAPGSGGCSSPGAAALPAALALAAATVLRRRRAVIRRWLATSPTVEHPRKGETDA